MYKATAFSRSLPPGGLRSALAGGNTVGGWLREKQPRTDGYRHIDTPGMIETLQRVGANHYFFGIWDSPTDWDDLRLEFAPAAQQAGIQLMPYIVPPSETVSWGRASRPYEMDYIAWAREFADLSVKYPVLTSWAIDDFDIGANATVFTPEYLAAIRTAQFEINPDLGFFTCAYYGSATSEAFMERYGPYIDGIIFPYLDGGNSNTVVSSTARRDIDAIVEVTQKHDVGLIFLVYAGRFLDGVLPPFEDYVGSCVRQGLAATAEGRCWGVVAYGLQVDGAPTISDERRSMYGNGRGAIAASQAPSAAGTFAELSCRVDVDPDAPRFELSFWHSRATQYWRLPQRGDYAIQVLIDGALVWQADLHDATWMHLWAQGKDQQGQFEVTSALRGKTAAQLTFRVTALRDVRDSSFDVGFDNIESIGFTLPDPGFEDVAAWTPQSSGGPIVAVVDVFVDNRPDQIIAAVAAEYASHPVHPRSH